MINMSKEVEHFKIWFTLSQIAIVFLALFLSLLVIGVHDLRRNSFLIQARLDKTIKLITSQLKNNQLPMAAQNIDQFLIFIINEKEGNLLVDRVSDNPEDDIQWKSYQTKLIYQMQKQNQGIIFYPDKASWQFWKPVHLIRYEKLPDLGWIVAAEALLKPDISIFGESYSRLTFLYFIIIFASASLALWVTTHKNFNLIKKSISDALEASLLSLTGENIWDKFKTHPETPKNMNENKTTPSNSQQSKEIKNQEYILPDLIKGKSESIERPLSPSPDEESFLDKKSSLTSLRPTPSSAPAMKKDTPAAQQPDALDDLTINISNVKSDLLKKMLKDLRGK